MVQSLMRRLIHLEQQSCSGISNEDSAYLEFYATLKNPEPAQTIKVVMIGLKSQSLEEIILEAQKLELQPDMQEVTSGQ